MRRLRYQVASSLDGYIAGPNGEFDWIAADPEIDFGALFKQYDTVVMGRRTFEVMLKQGGDGSMPGLDVVVFSQTLRQQDCSKKESWTPLNLLLFRCCSVAVFRSCRLLQTGRS
jgi:dihydrofolate reductase